MEFLSEEWVAAWVRRANADPTFVAAGAGFHGAVGAIVRPDDRWRSGLVHLRLEGDDGRWTGYDLGPSPDLVSGTLFTLSAGYGAWKGLVQQQFDPIRGLIQGRLRVHGQLSSVLRWTKAFRVMTKLAADLPTTFADDSTR